MANAVQTTLDCVAVIPLEKSIIAKNLCCFSLSQYPIGDKKDNSKIKLRLS